MLKIFSLLKSQRFSVLACMFLLIVNTAANLTLPALMSEIVNSGINGKDINLIVTYSLIMLAVASVGLAAYIGSVKFGNAVSSRFLSELAKKVYKKTVGLSYADFSKAGASALLTRSTEDLYMINEMTMSFIGVVATVPTLFIGGMILAFKEDVMLSLILFALLPVVLILTVLIGKRIVPRWETADKYIDEQNQIVRERMNGIRVIRAYNKEQYEHARLKKYTVAMADNIIKANTMSGLIGPVALFILNITTVLILYVGAVRIGAGNSIGAGSVIAVIQYVGLIMSALADIFFVIVFMPKVKVSCGRINEVLESPEAADAEDDFNIVINGNICFEHVGFKYDGADIPAINDVSFEIKQGEKVAFIGGTGAGKSTLLNMLLKFYPITDGKITVDGLDLKDISRKRIRENVSAAMQKSVVLKGTIGDNIKMGNENATEQDIMKAAEIAQLDKYISSLPDGLSHKLEQNGTNISGGQKQRVAIARAVLKEAPIYVFDDSFSALDFLTESRLRRRLNEALVGKTQIIITQRVATAMSADKIIVLDNGCVAGSGSHKELMNNCEIYKYIYESQIGGDLIEK